MKPSGKSFLRRPRVSSGCHPEKLFGKDLAEDGAEIFVAGEAELPGVYEAIHEGNANEARREKIKPDRAETFQTASEVLNYHVEVVGLSENDTGNRLCQN